MLIEGADGKPIVADLHYRADLDQCPVVIFCHGYKGFKDWGGFRTMASHFLNVGFALVRFNFSHNGGTPLQPIDFPDLEAFGQNNFTKELYDLDALLKVLPRQDFLKPHVDFHKIYLVGHSRGAGIAMIKSAADVLIKKLVTWAGVSDFKSRFPVGASLEQWKKDKIAYVENSRTGQQMPHHIQFYEDFIANEERFNIQTAVQKLSIPHLIIHGDEDTTVTIEEAYRLKAWSPNGVLAVIEGGNHTFGLSHPFNDSNYPIHFQKVLDKTTVFLKD